MSRRAPDPLVMRAARRPHEPAIRSEAVAWDRVQLLATVDACATALAGEGVGEGSRVAMLLADEVPAVLLMAAVRRLGAVLVPLNRRLAVPELQAQLDLAGVHWLVCDARHAATASEVATGGVSPLRVEALLAGAPCSATPSLRDEVDLDAPALIVFTSGTSGRPKAAVLGHGNLAASAHAWSGLLRPRPTDRWLLCLPLCHVAGLAVVARAERWGAELLVPPDFGAERIRAALETGVTHVSLVPAQLAALLDAREARPAPPTLRAVLLGGGPMPGPLLADARAAGYPVLTTYGLTETASGVAAGGADAATLADPGAARPLPGVELRIEPDGGPDGCGEILVRGEMVFRGYLHDPHASGAALRGGWLYTGDLGTLDDGGLLRVLDRRLDLIVSGGENVYPAEVEAVLATHPAVAEAAVVGQPHERWGAVPVAAVVIRPGTTARDEELAGHCRERLAAFKVPARFVRLEALPRTAFGKVSRRRVREQLHEMAP